MPIRELNKDTLCSYAEFDNHAAVYEVVDEEVGLHGYIAVHRRKPDVAALGATRYWSYTEPTEALREALRLSKLMSYKSMAAGLPYTGAKAVLIRKKGSLLRKKQLLERYAQYVNELSGAFVTGNDVGLKTKDVQQMNTITQYVIGSGVDSGYFTAEGVLLGIKKSLEHKTGSGTIAGKKFAVQGYGSTGKNVVSLLNAAGGIIYVSDIKKKRFKDLTESDTLQIVPPNELLHQDVDVFCPCALGGVITPEIIGTLRSSIIAGSANNQFFDTTCDRLLMENNILYAPDFVINAGGLISVVDEYLHGEHDGGRVLSQLSCIPTFLERIFIESKQSGLPTHRVAVQLLEEQL